MHFIFHVLQNKFPIINETHLNDSFFPVRLLIRVFDNMICNMICNTLNRETHHYCILIILQTVRLLVRLFYNND